MEDSELENSGISLKKSCLAKCCNLTVILLPQSNLKIRPKKKSTEQSHTGHIVDYPSTIHAANK